MPRTNLIPWFVLVGLLVVALPCSDAWAGQGWGQGRGQGRGEGHRWGRSQGQASAPVPTNRLHQEFCGKCHLAYPPMLMPSTGWQRILDQQAKHFGENLGLTSAQDRELRSWLNSRGAEHCQLPLARRIMQSLGGVVPARITQIPYLQRVHGPKRVSPEVWGRKSVGSPANCRACHPGAASWNFNSSQVRIPAP